MAQPTVAELAQYLGKEVVYRISDMSIRVTIMDLRREYGRTRFQIQPVSGSGMTWVDFGSVHPL